MTMKKILVGNIESIVVYWKTKYDSSRKGMGVIGPQALHSAVKLSHTSL